MSKSLGAATPQENDNLPLRVSWLKKSFVYLFHACLSTASLILFLAILYVLTDNLIIYHHCRQLRLAGATVNYGPKGGYFITVPAGASAKDFLTKGNGSINYLSHLHNVTLRMDKTHIFDADLELLKPVSGSLLISLNQTNITDKGLMTLKSHPCLFYVSVKKTKVSEKGLRQFRKDMGWTELKDYSQELE